MKLHICKAGAIADTNLSIPDWSVAQELGHEINGFGFPRPDDSKNWKPDAIISMSISQMDESFAAIERWPDVPLFCYNWDVYHWVWDNPRPREYNYPEYGRLLSYAKEIWVPSHCTGLRSTEWWGLHNWWVVKSSVPYWDHDNVRDDGYALCCLREIPDPWWGMFEKACEELGIPYKTTNHECSYKEYQDIVAGCRFLCAPLYELSTGGLSLLEGYYLGKPVLISDSKWNGAKDYFGNRARYFKHGDYENFKFNLKDMYDNPVKEDQDGKPTIKHRNFVEHNFSSERMVKEMLDRIEATI